jgi:CheY-like chemotaxis protein
MLLINKNIFIVEDNSVNRVIYQIALGKNGANLFFDQWGREAVDKLVQMKKIDLIILDLMLPNGESGFNVYEKIRAVPNYDKVPIIAVSAAESATAMSQAQKLGFSGFIAKPIDYQLFPKQIVQIIAGESIWV